MTLRAIGSLEPTAALLTSSPAWSPLRFLSVSAPAPTTPVHQPLPPHRYATVPRASPLPPSSPLSLLPSLPPSLPFPPSPPSPPHTLTLTPSLRPPLPPFLPSSFPPSPLSPLPPFLYPLSLSFAHADRAATANQPPEHGFPTSFSQRSLPRHFHLQPPPPRYPRYPLSPRAPCPPHILPGKEKTLCWGKPAEDEGAGSWVLSQGRNCLLFATRFLGDQDAVLVPAPTTTEPHGGGSS